MRVSDWHNTIWACLHAPMQALFSPAYCLGVCCSSGITDSAWTSAFIFCRLFHTLGAQYGQQYCPTCSSCCTSALVTVTRLDVLQDK